MAKLRIIAMAAIVIAILIGATYTYFTYLMPPPVGEPIKVGFALPLTSDVGRDMMRVHMMMAEKINEKGGVLVGGVRRPLELYFEDTEELPKPAIEKVILAIDKLITLHGVRFVYGGVLSEPAIAAQEHIATKYPGTMFFTVGAVTEVISRKVLDDYPKYKYTFRSWQCNVTVFMYIHTLPLAVVRAEYPKLSEVFILGEDLHWARATAGAITKWLAAHGYEKVGERFTPPGATDFTAELSEIMAIRPHAVILLYHATSLPVFKQAYDMGLMKSILFIAPDPIGARLEYWDDAEGKVLHAIIVATSPFFNEKLPGMTALYKEFRERYKTSPGVRIADFDVIPLLAKAIEEAGTAEDTDKIVEVLEKIEFKGPSGLIYKYTKSHDLLYHEDYAWTPILQWQGPYKYVTIWPYKVADGKLIMPEELEKILKG